MDAPVKERIEAQIKAHPIVLFMKGNADFPLCGFSANVVNILNQYHVPFHTVDVLQNEAIRQGIKEYSDWPTIPQLYVRGKFIGGSDIVEELHNRQELQTVLKDILPID